MVNLTCPQAHRETYHSPAQVFSSYPTFPPPLFPLPGCPLPVWSETNTSFRAQLSFPTSCHSHPTPHLVM